MSFSDGMKKVIQKIKDIRDVKQMDKSVSEFKKMREAIKNISAKKVGAK